MSYTREKSSYVNLNLRNDIVVVLLWVLMDVIGNYGCLWMPMSSWVSMGVYGFLWVPMGVYGNSNIKNIAYFLIQEPRRFIYLFFIFIIDWRAPTTKGHIGGSGT